MDILHIEQAQLQDSNKLSVIDDTAELATFIDYLLSMPSDDGEFAPTDVTPRDFT